MCQGKRHLDCGAQRIFVGAICGGARGALVQMRSHRNVHRVLRHVLVNGVIGEARQRANAFVNVYFRLRNANGLGDPQYRVDDAPTLALTQQLLVCDRRRSRCAPCAHCLENAAPIRTLRNREGDAPCPVPMVCIGWPFPQFGVPHSVQCSRSQIASHEFQNSVVIPL